MRKNLRIGITSKNYSHKRFIVDKIPSATYKDVRFLNKYFWKNLHLWIFQYYLGLTKKTPDELYIKLFLKFKYLFPNLFKSDILHFFNVINYSSKIPWVITVETCLPYNHLLSNFIETANPDHRNIKKDNYTIGVLEALSKENCKGLLAMSECAKNIQLEMLKAFPEYADKIKKKLIFLHPPQKLLINSIDEKGLSYDQEELMRFIFIGKDFFRKGGNEILNVFKELHETGKYKFELVLITDINNNEKFSHFSGEFVENALSTITQNTSWVKYHKNLPNEEVLKLIKKSHVGLLPTWMDTFGYSVLECQAGGCPVITTDLRALTEINSDELGWIINFPANRLKHPISPGKEEFDHFRQHTEVALRAILLEIFENRQSVKQKAVAGLHSISMNHDPLKYSQTLQEIYNGKLLN